IAFFSEYVLKKFDNNYPEYIKKYFKYIDVNYRDNDGNTLLFYACKNLNFGFITELTSQFSNLNPILVNNDNVIALFYCLNNYECTDALIKYITKNQSYKQFIEKYKNIMGENLLMQCIKYNNVNIFKLYNNNFNFDINC